MRKKQMLSPIFEGIGPLPQPQPESTPQIPKINERQLMEEWIEVAGPAVIEHVRPLKLEHHTLVLRSLSPVWIQELNYQKGRFIQQLNERLGHHLIREIRFERGELPPLPLQPARPEGPAWLHIPIPREVVEQIEKKLEHLEESETKESARRIMQKHYQVTRLHQRTRRPRR